MLLMFHPGLVSAVPDAVHLYDTVLISTDYDYDRVDSDWLDVHALSGGSERGMYLA